MLLQCINKLVTTTSAALPHPLPALPGTATLIRSLQACRALVLAGVCLLRQPLSLQRVVGCHQRAKRVSHVISDTHESLWSTNDSQRIASRTNITLNGSGFSEDILGKTRYRILVSKPQTPTFSGSTFTLHQRELLLSWDPGEIDIALCIFVLWYL